MLVFFGLDVPVFFITPIGLVLVLRGSSTFLYSKKRVTQGDRLSMFMYAIGTLPLIHLPCDPGQWKQLWYADDVSASGTLPELHNWFNLCSCDPNFGYRPEPMYEKFCCHR